MYFIYLRMWLLILLFSIPYVDPYLNVIAFSFCMKDFLSSFSVGSLNDEYFQICISEIVFYLPLFFNDLL